MFYYDFIFVCVISFSFLHNRYYHHDKDIQEEPDSFLPDQTQCQINQSYDMVTINDLTENQITVKDNHTIFKGN